MEQQYEKSDQDELEYDDSWAFHFNYSLQEELSKEESKRGWKVYCHCIHGKFRCGSCYKYWPSARVVVLFRYRLRSDRGTVLMRPFGQACRRSGVLPEQGIRKNCYGEREEDGDFGSDCREKACTQGICCQED
uniref:3CxxC-type domain-containing protein n=1 Tax=Scleropages formosus TaxID=113540 RepID=A0A8C9S997_SCLFO